MWIDDNGIVHAVSLPGSVHTLEEARANMEATAKLTEGKRRPRLVDLRKLGSIEREARRYYAGEENAKVVNAAAMLVGSPLTRVAAYFFFTISKPIFPVRLFTNEEKALKWLSQYTA